MVHIDIAVPFYNHNKPNGPRWLITRKIVRHLKNVQAALERIQCIVTFTMVGSEGEDSRRLVEDVLGEGYYYEFDQRTSPPGQLLNMLSAKNSYCLTQSAAKNPDISILMGSNDFLPLSFFEHCATHYDIEPRVYGVGTYLQGGNSVLFARYDAAAGAFDTTTMMWWNGAYSYGNRNPNFTGGVIGINRACYKQMDLSKWTHDEVVMESECLRNMNCKPVFTQGMFFFSLKTIDGTELTSLDFLRGELAGLLTMNMFPPAMQKEITENMAYLNSL